MTAGARETVALEAMPLFAGLPPEQLSALAGLLHRRSVLAGATLMLMEETGEVAYLIARGTVKVCAEQADGSEVILALLGAGEVVGELSLLGPRTRSASVVTLEACDLLALSRANFESCLRTMPALPLNLARLLARRLRLADAQIQALGTLDIAGRVARQILAFAEEYGEPAADGGTLIPPRLTQGDLAGMVGATRVRVNAAMVSFKRQGSIAVDDKSRITVRNRAALERRCR